MKCPDSQQASPPWGRSTPDGLMTDQQVKEGMAVLGGDRPRSLCGTEPRVHGDKLWGRPLSLSLPGAGSPAGVHETPEVGPLGENSGTLGPASRPPPQPVPRQQFSLTPAPLHVMRMSDEVRWLPMSPEVPAPTHPAPAPLGRRAGSELASVSPGRVQSLAPQCGMLKLICLGASPGLAAPAPG